MKIGIMGAGDVGATLGKSWARKGHQIMFGVRNTQSPKASNLLKSSNANLTVGGVSEAASFGDVIILAVPWSAVNQIIGIAGDLAGKILVDTTNPFTSDLKGTVIEPSTSAAEEIAKLAPKSKVVKAFNTIGIKVLNNMIFGTNKADVFICGSDLKSRTTVKKLATDLGFEVVDVGPLSNARLLEHLSLLWIELAFRQEMGPNIAFKLLTREDEM
ncbi:MAG TPA: NADPH-dependent F420 reductase [Nitrososphaeraceae archaeon]